MRFSLKYLFLITTLAALACAALIFAGPWWSAICFTASVGLILASFVLAYAAIGAARAYWIGFAVLGCGYWMVLELPIAHSLSDSEWQVGTFNPLISARILDWAYRVVLPMVRA